MDFWTSFESPVGVLFLAGDGAAVSSIHMGGAVSGRRKPPEGVQDDSPFEQALAELREYFAGERTEFGFEIAFRRGNEFEQRAWRALLEIPYGETWSYKQQAEFLGLEPPDGPRDVGQANKRNPVAIAVPCHRVIGSDGSLVGYGGGLQNKRVLLDLEAGRPSLDGLWQD